MNLDVPKGKYVLAVSGGVDSMALLNMLSNLPDVDLVVAHFNHGIRHDSSKDEALVVRAAARYGLPIEIGRAKLGAAASEESARAARYDFLKGVRDKHSAKAIITAHHQDDLIETAVINLLRGTGRRGLSAIAQNPEVVRPLLEVPKSRLIKYAKQHHIPWREDSTNQDPAYLRNYIRQKILPRLTKDQKNQLLESIKELGRLNPVLDREIAILSQSLLSDSKIIRQKFTALPPEIASEVLAGYLRRHNVRQFDQKTLARLSTAIKTAKPGTKHDVSRGSTLEVSKAFAHLNVGVKA